MSSSSRKLARRSDRAPTRAPRLEVSFSDLSRIASVHRSSVTRACAPGGPLHAAVTARGRVDVAAQAVVDWLASHSGTPAVLVSEPDTVSLAEAARQRGVPVSDVLEAARPGGALHGAVLAQHHVPAIVFTVLAGVTLAEVLDACRAELAPAVTRAGGIDLTHPSALAFLAAHPFRRTADGDVDAADVPDGMLSPALGGEDIDPTHPFARAFLARCGEKGPAV
jgi:hypothetical protein